MSRTYTQDEVREIIRRATEATAERERMESEDSGLSMDDLADLATSAGIDPQTMIEAARSLDRDVHEPFERRMMGMKISAAHAIRIEGSFSEEDWQALVSDCRTTFKAKGNVQDSAGLREWSNGNLHILVEPAGDDTIIRMRTHNGAAQNMLGAGVAMAVAMLMAAISSSQAEFTSIDLFGKMMILFATLFGGGAFIVTRMRNWSRTRQTQMEAIGRRIEQRRSRHPAAIESTSGLQDVTTERLDLPDDAEEPDPESVGIRRRERG